MSVLSDEQLIEKYSVELNYVYDYSDDYDQAHCAGLRAVADAAIAADRASRSEPVVVDSLARACSLAGVDYQTSLRIRAYMPVATPPAAPASDQIAAAVKAERERIYALIDTNPEHIWRDAGFMQWRAKRSQETE